MTGPLSDLRLVELGQLLAGPYCGQLLGDYGAEVIKIEGPGALDPFRDWTGADGGTDWWNRSPFYNFTNRGKRSVCLDLKDPRGQAVILRLLESVKSSQPSYQKPVDLLPLATP